MAFFTDVLWVCHVFLPENEKERLRDVPKSEFPILSFSRFASSTIKDIGETKLTVSPYGQLSRI